MVDVDKLSDAEIRTKLLEFGYPVMPITGTTRKLMVKKLKLLLDTSKKSNNDGRMSLGRYSSEEESDTELKSTKKEKNRRATMAAPAMQPPSSSSRPARKSRVEKSSETTAIVPPSPKKETRNSTVTTTTSTRTQKIIRSAKDEFDTGSESESDIIGNNSYNNSASRNVDYGRDASFNYTNPSPRKFSPPKSTVDTSYSRNVSYTSTSPSPSRYGGSLGGPQSSASEYAAERLNQIRSRLSLGSPSYVPPTTTDKFDKEETPFLSNFTRRLSALSSHKNDYDSKNDIIKENDVNGAASYTRSHLSNYRVSRGRDQIYDYKTNQKSILRNNFVSFSVLAGAALFFVFLAIIYLGMRSDTSIISSGKSKPNFYVPQN